MDLRSSRGLSRGWGVDQGLGGLILLWETRMFTHSERDQKVLGLAASTLLWAAESCPDSSSSGGRAFASASVSPASPRVPAPHTAEPSSRVPLHAHLCRYRPWPGRACRKSSVSALLGKDSCQEGSELPGKSLGEQVNSLHLLWVTRIQYHQAVEIPIAHVTCDGT